MNLELEKPFHVTTKSGLEVELPNFLSIPFDILEAWMADDATENVLKNIKLFKQIPEFAKLTAACGVMELAQITKDWAKATQVSEEELGK